MNICVTSIGSIAGSFIVKRLKELGHHVTGLNVHNFTGPAQKFCDDFVYVPHSSSENQYISEIFKLVRDLKINAILPLTDPESYLLATNAETLKLEGVAVLAPNFKSLALVRDKYNLFNDSSKWHVEGFGPIPSFKNSLDALKKCGLPLLGKPAIGRSRLGHVMITEENHKYLELCNYIFQPYIEGLVITIDAIRKADDNFFYCLPRYELERTSNGAGTKVKIFQDQRIERFVKKVLDYYCIDGCVNLELLKKNDFYYLMDFNLRSSAGIEFSYQAGADFIGALLTDKHDISSYFSDIDPILLERKENGKVVKL